MSRRAFLLLLASITASLLFPVQAEQTDFTALTRNYVATLDKDPIKQATFYTDNTLFSDPTSGLFGEPWRIEGGDKIVGFFVQAAQDAGTLQVDYQITDLLVQAPFVIANITSTVESCGTGMGLPTKAFKGDIRMVMILEFNHNKVAKRTDYVDYASAFATMDKLKPQIALQPDDPRCAASE